ncbi:replicative helicase loader/inhibitor [Paenibacillus sedimenti]|uniref:Replicative helicase inhibitor G39P N-terminal domain-containing protein n=1 Tax=Paenibacillus sedimenti TaxID=2770274 RepID=A0A926KS23_9BACL|nr:replicative helicase loader/inhibitor [Paenibacillus sedimenti]MBD0381233.1 hypothetical protein [Paenibacillus sedimenti]
MKQTETAKFLAAIKTFFPNFEITTAVTHGWQSMLEDVSFERAQQNLAQHIKTNRFPPTIADIRCEAAPKPIDKEIEARNRDIAFSEWVRLGKDPEDFVYDGVSDIKRLSS